ncbi:hypothetical protein CU098_012169 [Rhizopus stolonifer]|uniref:Uncharacterized protein n=1 Tax=Rhizopus stolonifer TaxID=4846 RepID=A0A367KMA1_RHIST|nr:hypothetical protein CU098_012169 [Rhizopus stolonifer]
MTQSPGLRFFNGLKDKQKKTTKESTESPDNVQGWLMSVHSFDKDDKKEENGDADILLNIVDADNNSIPLEKSKRTDGRPESIHSVDSVNLDELINANYTADMEDETDLTDLANLDIIDDSTEDFWKVNQNEEMLDTFDSGFNDYMTKSVELDWNAPTDIQTNVPKPMLKPVSKASALRKRSDSLSSDNSLTSQSTVTQYAKYGMTPMVYPSESSSSSSRPLSRLSNYSAGSLASSSGASHHPRTNGTGIPTPSRSYTSKKGSKVPTTANTARTQLSKRASHIPAPASHHSPPAPQKTLSSSSTASASRRSRIPNQRASHIPTMGTARPASPQATSRVGMRSPTPGSRLFSKTEENKRILTSPTTNTNRSSGLRPPNSSSSNGRSVSRIGIFKKV